MGVMRLTGGPFRLRRVDVKGIRAPRHGNESYTADCLMMTQFQPPPFDPRGASPVQAYGTVGEQRRPWSAAAITGFVLSLLGCVGITALLGFIFGIIGVVRTKEGQRRGLGLAIAAIPISLITGAISVLIGFSLLVLWQMGPQFARLGEALESSDPAATVTAIRTFSSDSFNQAVSDEDLRNWLDQVRTAHGKLVEPGRPAAPPTETEDGGIRFSQQAKFVNGTASVTIELKRDGLLSFQIDDFAVDGVSPRKTD